MEAGIQCSQSFDGGDVVLSVSLDATLLSGVLLWLFYAVGALLSTVFLLMC